MREFLGDTYTATNFGSPTILDNEQVDSLSQINKINTDC